MPGRVRVACRVRRGGVREGAWGGVCTQHQQRDGHVSTARRHWRSAQFGGGQRGVHMRHDPRVLQQVADGGPPRGLLRQRPRDEVHGRGAQPGRHLGLLVQDGLHRALARGHAKGRAADEELVREHAARPRVNLGGVREARVVFILGGLALIWAKHDLCTDGGALRAIVAPNSTHCATDTCTSSAASQGH